MASWRDYINEDKKKRDEEADSSSSSSSKTWRDYYSDTVSQAKDEKKRKDYINAYKAYNIVVSEMQGEYNDRYSSDAFQSDAVRYAGRAKAKSKEYETVSKNLKKHLSEQKKNMSSDDYEKALSTIKEGDRFNTDYLDTAKNGAEYYSQWVDENAFNKAKEEREYISKYSNSTRDEREAALRDLESRLSPSERAEYDFGSKGVQGPLKTDDDSDELKEASYLRAYNAYQNLVDYQDKYKAMSSDDQLKTYKYLQAQKQYYDNLGLSDKSAQVSEEMGYLSAYGSPAVGVQSRRDAYAANGMKIAQLEMEIADKEAEYDRRFSALKSADVHDVYDENGKVKTEYDTDSLADEIKALELERDTLKGENTNYDRLMRLNDDASADVNSNGDYAEVLYKYFGGQNTVGDIAPRDPFSPQKQTIESPKEDYSTYINSELDKVFTDETAEGDPLLNVEALQSNMPELFHFLSQYTPYVQTEAGGYANNFAEGQFYRYLTKEDVSNLAYYVATGQTDKAEAYANNLKRVLEARVDSSLSEAARNISNNGNFLDRAGATITSNVLNVTAGIPAFLSDTVSMAAGQERDPYDVYHMGQNVSGYLRGAVSDYIKENNGGFAQFLYNAGTSATDSFIGAALFGRAYTGIMGMSAAAQRAKELYERGVSDDKITANALAHGVSEALFEYISLDKLLSTESPTSVWDAIKKALAQAGVEGTEEINTDVMNTIVDAVTLAGQSDFSESIKKLMNENPGMTYAEARKEAEKQKLEDLLMTGLEGAVSGFLMSGMQAATGFYSNTKTGEQTQKAGELDNYLEAAKYTDKDSDAFKRGQAISEKIAAGEEVGNAEVGALVEDVERELSNPSDETLKAIENHMREVIEKQTAEKETAPARSVNGSEEMTEAFKGLGMSEDSVDKLSALYEESEADDVDSFAEGLIQAYTAGLTGTDYDNMKGSYLSSLTETQREAAYNRGAIDRTVNIDRQNTRRIRSEAKGNFKGVHFATDEMTLRALNRMSTVDDEKSARQNMSVRITDNISKAFGLNLKFYASEVGADGVRYYIDDNGKRIKNAPNGMYKQGGALYIDLNAGDYGEGTILYTLGHEVTHFIKEFAPKQFDTFGSFLANKYSGKGIDINDLIDAQIALAEEGGRSLTRADAWEEVVANSSMNMFADEKFYEVAEELKQQDRGTWEKIKDFFKELISRISAALDKYKDVKPGSAEAQIVSEWGDTLDKLRTMYAEAFVEASNIYSNAEQKNNASEGVRYMARDTVDEGYKTFTESVLNMTNIEAISKRQHKIGVVSESHASLINQILTREFGIDIDVSDYEIWIGGNAVKHIEKRHGKNGSHDKTMSDKDERSKAGWVLNNATMGEALKDENGNLQFNNEYQNEDQSKSPVVRLGVATGDSMYYVVECVPDSKQKRLHIISQYKEKISKANRGQLLNINDFSFPQSTSETPVTYNGFAYNNDTTQSDESQPSAEKLSPRTQLDADYMKAVESGDMETAQRMVDEAAKRAMPNTKVVDENGNPRIVYHQSPENFNIFRRGTRDGLSGRGIYFSYFGESFGRGNVKRRFYVNITNPITNKILHERAEELQEPFISGKWVRYDGQIKQTALYDSDEFDGVMIRSDELVAKFSGQIKSADPVTYDDEGNVIPLSERFNEENKDIRFSSRSRSVYDTVGETQRLQRENRELSNDVEGLMQLLKLQGTETHGTVMTKASVDRAASAIMQKYRLKGKAELSNRLSAFYTAIASEARNGTLTWDTVQEEGLKAAEWIYSHADDRTEDKGVTKILSDIFSVPVKLTEVQKGDAASAFDTYNGFRRAVSGAVKVNSNARMYLDEQWQEWAEMYPEWFDVNTKEADMPAELVNIVRQLRDAQYVVEEFDEVEMKREIISDLYDSYWDVMPMMTVADKYAKQISALRAEHSNRMEELRESRDEKLRDQQTYYRDMVDRLRKNKNDKIDEIRKHASEQRLKGIEQRKQTRIKNKIKKLSNELSTRLLNPKESKYVPQGLVKVTADALTAITSAMDTGKSESLTNKLYALQNRYSDIQKDGTFSAAYNEVTAELVRKLSDLPNKQLSEMSSDELQQVYDTFAALKHAIVESVRMTDSAIKLAAYEVGEKMIAETSSVEKSHTKGFVNWFRMQVRPETMFKALGGWTKDGVWEQLAKMLDDGQLTMTQIQMEATSIFDSVLLGKENQKALRELLNPKDLVDAGLVDERGNSVKITRGMMLSLYMHLLNEDNARHVILGGIKVPDIKRYYAGKSEAWGSGSVKTRGLLQQRLDIKEQLDELNNELDAAEGDRADELRRQIDDLVYERDTLVDRYASTLRTTIENQLTDYEKRYIAAAQVFFDEYSKGKLTETNLKRFGFAKKMVEHYFPARTDSDYRNAQFDSIARDFALENSGSMKERVTGASNPLILEDITDVANSQVKFVSKYCGMMIPIWNFTKAYGAVEGAYETSVQAAVKQKFGEYGAAYINKLMGDLTGGKKANTTFIDAVLSKARSGLAASALTINLRVALAQAASYPTALAELDVSSLTKALARGGKNNWTFSRADQELIAKYSPLLWYRLQGYATQSLGDLKDQAKLKNQANSKMKAVTGWINFFDGATIGRLWYATEYYIQKHNPELQKGTDEYYKAVAEKFNKVVERTQPNYTTFQKPDILRTESGLMKLFNMFMTQRLQNFNIMYEATAEYNAYARDLKKGLNGVTKEDVKQKRNALVRATASQVAATTTIVAMKFLTDALIHSLGAYKDDDDELTAESILAQLGNNWAESIVSNTVFGSEIYAIITSVLRDERYYGVSLNGVDTIADGLLDFTKAASNLVKGDTGKFKDASLKLGKDICQFMGIPANNAYKLGNGIYQHINDIVNGNFLNFNGTEGKTNAQLGSLVYKYIVEGDDEKAEEYRRGFKSESAYRSALKTALKDNDERIEEAARARFEGRISEEKAIENEILAESNFDADIIRSAVDSLAKSFEPKDEEDDEWWNEEGEEKSYSIYSSGDITKAFGSGNYSDANEMISNLVEFKVSQGKTEKEARSSVRSTVTSYWKDVCENEVFQTRDANRKAEILRILTDTGLYANKEKGISARKGAESAVSDWEESWKKEQKK